jgi:hypothetical protein
MKGVNQCSMANAFLWICAILAAAVLLKGTEYLTPMLITLAGVGGVSICYSECKGKEHGK